MTPLFRFRLLPLCGLILAGLASLPARATNGTMPHGYGIASQGMGGASIALPQDAVAAANNPSGMALLGEQLELGLAVVLPKPSATFGGTTFDGGGLKAIPVPEFGYVRPLDTQQTVGVSVYGNGVATKYRQSISGGADSASDGANLTQVIVSPTYTLKLSASQAVGVSLDLAYQRFRVTGVPDANGVEGQGYESSTGVGLKLGWTGEVLPGISLGAMYASRIHMGKLKAYSALLAEGGQFDVPERYGLGLAVRAPAGLTFAADVMRVNWGDIASLGNALTDPQPGFGWRNQTIVRAGVAWDVQPQWTLRAGYSHGSQIVSSDNTTLNYLAPVTPQQHLTLGTTWKFDPHQSLSLAYARAIGTTVHGTGASTGVDVRMSQNWLAAAWSYAW